MMDDESIQPCSDASGEKRGKRKQRKKWKSNKLETAKDDTVVRQHYCCFLFEFQFEKFLKCKFVVVVIILLKCIRGESWIYSMGQKNMSISDI